MSFFKIFYISFIILFFMVSYTNCSSSKQINTKTDKNLMQDFQQKTSFNLGETYYQHWVAGIKGGGSGIIIFINVQKNKNNVVLDSVYFRGMQKKLNSKKTGYAANFKTEANQKEDIILSDEINAEYLNELPNKVDFPFQLKDNDCVISYLEENTTKYFKIENLVEKPREHYPSAAPKQ